MKRCRFPFGGDLNARSGPDVLIGALSEALRADPRFVPLTDDAPGAEEVDWHPALSPRLIAAVRAGRRCAIGPNALYGFSQAPGAGPVERELMAFRGYTAVFALSRWYVELLRMTLAQRAGYALLDFPLPRAWAALPWTPRAAGGALVYLKGGAAERGIALALLRGHARAWLIEYGRYARAELLDAARRAEVCYYVSREEHFGLAAVEIGLMGCPIVSDEKCCPTVSHGLTGRLAAARERDTRAPFAWAPDAAERFRAEYSAARAMDRTRIRQAVLARHDPYAAVARAAAALDLEDPNDGGAS